MQFRSIQATCLDDEHDGAVFNPGYCGVDVETLITNRVCISQWIFSQHSTIRIDPTYELKLANFCRQGSLQLLKNIQGCFRTNICPTQILLSLFSGFSLGVFFPLNLTPADQTQAQLLYLSFELSPCKPSQPETRKQEFDIEDLTICIIAFKYQLSKVHFHTARVS